MDIHVDIRRYLEIHAWICYGFSDQGAFSVPARSFRDLLKQLLYFLATS